MKIEKLLRSLAVFTLIAVMGVSLAACASQPAPAPSAPASTPAAPATPASAPAAKNYPDTITVVWYPNESANDYAASRQKLYSFIEQATGKKVIEKLTTDYAIAIESLAGGTAQIGAVMGAVGYIQAQQSNPAVKALLVNSDANGALDGARYFSWLAVNKADASGYMKDGKYAIDNIKGKKMSFVSNSSTSGFKVPTTNIIAYFAADKLDADKLVEGGPFFSEVLFGGSHQGSAVNLLSGKADVAAFCDTELIHYAEPVSGDQMTVGSVWKVRDDATDPFATLKGKEFSIISVSPVLNGPFAYNSDTLSPEDVKAIQDLLTSDTVASEPLLFFPADGSVKGFFKKTDGERFVLVDDSWYDPLRG